MEELVQIMGTFVAKRIWKAWEDVKPWLCWAHSSFLDDISLNQQNIWWSSLFSSNGQPLAKLPWIKVLRFHKKGIQTLQ